MNLQLQRGGGVLIRKPERRDGIVLLLGELGVDLKEFLPQKQDKGRWMTRGGTCFYRYNYGRLDIVMYEANRAWKRKVKALGDTSLCRELNDAWNRVKYLLNRALHPKLTPYSEAI